MNDLTSSAPNAVPTGIELDVAIVGGGVSKNYEDFFPFLKLQTRIVPAVHRNNAGILGSAALASPIPAAAPEPEFETDAR